MPVVAGRRTRRAARRRRAARAHAGRRRALGRRAAGAARGRPARGFAVTRAGALRSARLGDFYASLRDDRVAWVVTLDALFFVAHLALDRAHRRRRRARSSRPSMATMLRRLDIRLAAESRGGARRTWRRRTCVARGVVAVALALAAARLRRARRARAAGRRREGPRARALGDWRQPVARGAARLLGHVSARRRPIATRRTRAGSARWRGSRGPRSRSRGAARATVRCAGRRRDGARARAGGPAARAAARATTSTPRPPSAWDRVERAGELLVGDADDTDPRDLSVAAAGAEARPAQRRTGSRTWRTVDRVRRAAARRRARLASTTGARGAHRAAGGHRSAAAHRAHSRRASASSARASTPDSELLQSLVFPMVGGLLGARAAADVARRACGRCPRRSTSRRGSARPRRARALHASGDDAYARIRRDARSAGARAPARGLDRAAPDAVPVDARRAGDLAAPVGGRPRAAGGVDARVARAQGGGGARRVDRAAARRDRDVAGRRSSTCASRPARAGRVGGAGVRGAAPGGHREAPGARAPDAARALVGAGIAGGAARPYAVLDEVDDLSGTALGVAVHEAADQPVPPALLAGAGRIPRPPARARGGARRVRRGATFRSSSTCTPIARRAARSRRRSVRVGELWIVDAGAGDPSPLAGRGRVGAARRAGPADGRALSDAGWRAALAPRATRRDAVAHRAGLLHRDAVGLVGSTRQHVAELVVQVPARLGVRPGARQERLRRERLEELAVRRPELVQPGEQRRRRRAGGSARRCAGRSSPSPGHELAAVQRARTLRARARRSCRPRRRARPRARGLGDGAHRRRRDVEALAAAAARRR